MYNEIEDLTNFKQVNCLEFQRFFKEYPEKTYPKEDRTGIMMADLYSYKYYNYNNELVGIFRGANGVERFSSYWIRKDLAIKYKIKNISLEDLEQINNIMHSIEYYNNNQEWFLPNGTKFKWKGEPYSGHNWWDNIYNYLKNNEND